MGNMKSPPDSDARRLSIGRVPTDVALLLAVAALLLVPSFFTRHLWPPDETRYMEVSWEMATAHQYLVPFSNGEPYTQKPPLFFWLGAWLYRMGFGLAATRAVAALAATGTAMLTYVIGRRHLRGPGPLLSAVITLTTLLFMVPSKIGGIDALLCFLMMAAICCGLYALEADARRGVRCWLAAYLFLGLAVLAKGPVGMVVPALVVSGCALAEGKRPSASGAVHVLGVTFMLAVALVWAVPAALAGGREYADELMFRQSLGRVARSFSHSAPFYHYLMLSPALFLPWSLLLIPALASAVEGWRRREPLARQGLVWFATVFLFFSLMSGKRSPYLLPMLPAAGLLLARYFAGARPASSRQGVAERRAIGFTIAALATALAIGLAVAIRMPEVVRLLTNADVETAQEILGLGRGLLRELAPAAAVGFLILGFAWREGIARGRLTSFAAAMAAFMIWLSLVADVVGFRRLDRFRSGNEFGLAAAPLVAQADRVFLYRKDFEGVYNLQFQRAWLPVLENRAAVEHAMSWPQKTAVVILRKDLTGRTGWPLRNSHIAAMGHTGVEVFCLLTNWPPASSATPQAGEPPPR